ncbi:MAG: hypothetical protein MJ249_02055 [Kiritimatiellae bacterium]|nr:hypothetical protein [Kiritimatiellia bacterium]
MRTSILACVFAVCLGASAFSQHRSFRGGFPVGTGGAGARVQRQAALSEKNMPGVGRTTGRKKNIRLVKAEGSFAMKCAKGDPVLVELQEPKGTRWMTPPASGKYTCLIERGATARKRSANVSGGEGTAVATVRRLSDKDVELTLKRVKIGASPKDDPEETITIGLVAP